MFSHQLLTIRAGDELPEFATDWEGFAAYTLNGITFSVHRGPSKPYKD
jgi:hypothetical protein